MTTAGYDFLYICKMSGQPPARLKIYCKVFSGKNTYLFLVPEMPGTTISYFLFLEIMHLFW